MKRNNKWRRRIIRLLENVLANLQSRPPGPSQLDIVNEVSALSDRADSIMSSVEDVEVAETLYYMKSISIPKTDDSVLYRLKDCLEDTAFAIYCGMQDATYFRLFSARAWREFALGSIGVQTATFCTNSAYFQTEFVSEQLRTVFGHLEDDSRMTQIHTKIDRFMREHIANDMDSVDTHPDSVNPYFDDVSLARNASRRLGYYASFLLCSRLSTLLFEVFLAQRCLYPVNTLEETRLLKSLAQLRCLEWADNAISEAFKTDCMYEAARSVVRGHLDTDAVFAAQMLYDIQQQVDPQSIPLEDITEALRQDYIDLYAKHDPELMSEEFDFTQAARAKRMLDQYELLGHIDKSISDIQQSLERWEYATPRQHTIRRFKITRHVPLLIGQMVAQHHEEFHVDFLDISNDRGHILAAMHLYNAAKESGTLPSEALWDDMEWVMANQDELHVFGDSLADTDSKYLECFCKAYGLDHSKFSTERQPVKPGQVKNDVRLKGGSPRRLESCTRYVRAFSEFKSLRNSKPTEWRLRMMQAFADYELDAFSAHGSPHSIGILIAAKEAHEGDEEALAFDIFAFHTVCHKLLSAIRRACSLYAPDDYPGISYDDREGLNTTVAEILRNLLHGSRHQKSVWPLAVTLLGEVIKKEGSTCIDMAYERMKITTLDSISMDSDDDRSETMSLRSGALTPSPEPSKTDNSGRVVDVSTTSNARVRENGEGSQAATATQDSDELHDQNEQHINDILNMSVKKLPNGSMVLLAPKGSILESWPLHGAESQAESQTESKLIPLQRLLRECQEGRMTLEKLENGDILFRQDGNPKVFVALPVIEFTVVD